MLNLGEHVRGQLCDVLHSLDMHACRSQALELFDRSALDSLTAAAGSLDPGRSTVSQTGMPFLFVSSLGGPAAELRFLTDPAAYGVAARSRVEIGLHCVDALCAANGISSDDPILPRVIRWLLPPAGASRRQLRRGAAWVGFAISESRRTRMSIYFDAAWGAQHERWTRPFGLLLGSGATECADLYESLIPCLNGRAEPLGVAVESDGTRLAAVKVYFRSNADLAAPIELSGLGDVFTELDLQAFFAVLGQGARKNPAAASVYYLAFDLRADRISGLKVDVCNHCLGHSDLEIEQRLMQISGRFRADPGAYTATLAVLSKVEQSSHQPPLHEFVSMAMSARGEVRFNAYLRPAYPRRLAPRKATAAPPAKVAAGGMPTPVGFADTAVDRAIGSAITFLADRQLPNGSFSMLTSRHRSLDDAWLEDSAMGTASIAYSLGFAPGQVARRCRYRARQFLVDEMEAPGVWRYWPRSMVEAIDPDLDDTALISFVLRESSVAIRNGINHQIILANREGSGMFKTWIRSVEAGNDVDAVVNANVLLYLGPRPEAMAACDYLNRIIAAQKEQSASWYYLDALSLYYAISRAWLHGVRPLEPSRAPIVVAIRQRQRADGAFGDVLATALALCTMRNFRLQDPVVLEVAEQSLLAAQCADGSWPAVAVWAGPEPPRPQSVYWGSSELTAAVCLEALSRGTIASLSFPTAA